jgi:hypothetical protein
MTKEERIHEIEVWLGNQIGYGKRWKRNHHFVAACGIDSKSFYKFKGGGHVTVAILRRMADTTGGSLAKLMHLNGDLEDDECERVSEELREIFDKRVLDRVGKDEEVDLVGARS